MYAAVPAAPAPAAVWYHPGYIPAPAAYPPTQGETGDYWGGVWYPKQNGTTGSDNGIDESSSEFVVWATLI